MDKIIYEETKRERKNRFNREYRSRNKGKANAAVKAWREAHPGYSQKYKPLSLEYVREYRKMHPHYSRVVHIVQNELEQRRLIKKPCEICKSTEHIHAHHEDYNKALEIIWLCRSCHFKLHKIKRQMKGRKIKEMLAVAERCGELAHVTTDRAVTASRRQLNNTGCTI